MTTNSQSKSGAVCKTCSKPGFKGADGKMRHERRGDPTVYGGRRADPKAAKGGAASGDGDTKEREPDREHPLNRRVFGKRED